MNRSAQLALDFTPGLTAQHRSITSITAATVYNARGGLSSVAADLDTSPSDLSRRLNGADSADNRPLTVEQFVSILRSTRDYRPIYWLIEEFLQDPDARRTQAIEQLAALAPVIERLVEQSGVPTKGRR